MVKEICLAGTTPNIATLLKEYRIPDTLPVLMLLEQQPQHIIEPEQQQDLLYFAHFKRSFDWDKYTSGRIFHQDGELRWEKQASTFHVIYTGQTQYSPELKDTASLLLDSCSVKTKRYYLFGKRLNSKELDHIGAPAQVGDFAELRIPRLLRYPILPTLENAERVQFMVKEYSDPDTSLNIAFRFTKLAPEPTSSPSH